MGWGGGEGGGGESGWREREFENQNYRLKICHFLNVKIYYRKTQNERRKKKYINKHRKK